MERSRPETNSNEIELYIRTYYSVLRSSGDVKVRSFEESHVFSNSSLHLGARDSRVDLAAFGYAAKRLPDCMHQVEKLVLGQSEDQFEFYGYDVRSWARVRTPGRRRPLRFDGKGTLAVFITSASDIDDLVPIVTAYQIEWNKLSQALKPRAQQHQLAQQAATMPLKELKATLEKEAGMTDDLVEKLEQALSPRFAETIQTVATRRSDFNMKLLAASFSQYQRSAQRWWSGIEPIYLGQNSTRRRPVYFVSSNTHSLPNLLCGYARAHADDILNTAREHEEPELIAQLESAMKHNEGEAANLLYFALRQHIQRNEHLEEEVCTWDEGLGLFRVPDPGHVEVSAQVIDIKNLDPKRFDSRIWIKNQELLAKSDAMIINIDYPLGMAAYQLLSRLGQGVGSLLGVYVMGKAATLNGRVGDVMISNAVHDEHSQNTYLFHNHFSAKSVQPYLHHGTVLDNQKALTVRSAFLQNRQYMGVFYREGYTVLEMEAGPYLSAIFEQVDPRRHPNDEIVRLNERTPFDVGILHYASDTPYSRRQELLSKSLSYFGMDSTYASSVAIVRRILELEVQRIEAQET